MLGVHRRDPGADQVRYKGKRKVGRGQGSPTAHTAHQMANSQASEWCLEGTQTVDS